MRSDNKFEWGFTITELLVAMIASALLALTVGAMLVVGTQSWRRNHAAVELQRDAAVAGDMLRRAVRMSTKNGITLSAGGSRLDIFTPGGTNAFYASGSDLVYDPNTGTTGDEITVVNARLAAFSATVTNTGVSVLMQLSSGDENTEVNTFLRWRN